MLWSAAHTGVWQQSVWGTPLAARDCQAQCHRSRLCCMGSVHRPEHNTHRCLSCVGRLALACLLLHVYTHTLFCRLNSRDSGNRHR